MKLVALSLSILLLAALSCKKAEEPPASNSEAQLKPLLPAEPTATDRSGIAWFHNDYDQARARALRDNKPLIVDMWAAWCHTCLSMKHTVLSDPGLAGIAKQYVWLSIDTEDPSSAAVMKRFPPKVWPTFLAVSPQEQSVQATQLGSCSIDTFRDFAARGLSGHLAQLEASGGLDADSPLAHLRAGDRAWLDGNYREAASSYALARKNAGQDWVHTPLALKNEISALAKLDDLSPCATLGASQLAVMAKHQSSATTDFIINAGNCAIALGATGATQLYGQLLATLDTVLADPAASLSYDDRSDALHNSRIFANELNQGTRAFQYARAQQALLAEAVDEAETAIAEMTYVWHQVEVHAFLGEGQAIVAWVQSLETRLPQEYDPPYRLAWLWNTMKRYPEAHAAIQRALPLLHGARKGRLLHLDAEVYKAEGNRARERAQREAVLAHYQSLPPGLRSASKILAAQQAIVDMGVSE